jgi:TonB family protein
VPTELDKAAVRAGMATVKPAVVACGEKSGDKGTVKIAMKVKPDGMVEDASVASAPNDALGSCVATALRKAQFAKTVNGGSFTYPFAF